MCTKILRNCSCWRVGNNIRGFLGSKEGPLRKSMSSDSPKIGHPVKFLQTSSKLEGPCRFGFYSSRAFRWYMGWYYLEVKQDRYFKDSLWPTRDYRYDNLLWAKENLWHNWIQIYKVRLFLSLFAKIFTGRPIYGKSDDMDFLRGPSFDPKKPLMVV